MARVVPSASSELESERLLVEALEAQLDDAFTIFVNLKYLRGSDLANGEVDVLVTHRVLGFCFIECKGFGVTCDEDGTWWRAWRGRPRERLRRTPMDQIRRHAEAILEAVRPTMASAVTHAGEAWTGVASTWMLAFPLTRVSEDIRLPPGLPREAVLDAADLQHVGNRVRAMMERGRARQPFAPMPEPAWSRAIRDALYPPLGIVPDLGGQLDAGRRRAVRLDTRQRTIIECVSDNDRFRVHGPAGTGKSLLALETARRWACDRGRHVLLVCFNRMLRAHLERAVDALQLDAGQVTVRHFHGLVYEALVALDRADTLPAAGSPRDVSREFWEQTAPPAIAEAVEAGLIPRYDALVVDEAQDLHADWWLYLSMVLPDPDADPLVAFYDPAQAVYGRETSVPDHLFTLRLHENYRNPRAVVETIAAQSLVTLRPHPDAPEGEPVREYRGLSPTRLARKLHECISRYLEEGLAPIELVILGPHRLRNSSLAGVTELAELEITEDLEARGDRLLYATVPAFKGLDAPVVFFIDVDASDPRCGRGVQYVGASRATHALHLFTRGAGRC